MPLQAQSSSSDPNNIRSGKTESNRFFVSENRHYAQVLEEVQNNAMQVRYSCGHDLISQQRNGATYFYHYDGLDSSCGLRDSSGVHIVGNNLC